MIIEIDRRTLKRECNNNIKKAIVAGWYMEWTPDKIRRAFAYGKGTIKDFERYKRDNKQFCIFLEV